MPHGDKREAYGADITYGTNNREPLLDSPASAPSYNRQLPTGRFAPCSIWALAIPREFTLPWNPAAAPGAPS